MSLVDQCIHDCMFSHCLAFSYLFIGVALSLGSVLSVVLVYLSLTVSASYVVSVFLSTLSLSLSISISILSTSL